MRAKPAMAAYRGPSDGFAEGGGDQGIGHADFQER